MRAGASKLSHYLRLLADVRTIVRTLRKAYGAPRPPAGERYRPDHARRIADRIHPSSVKVRIAQLRRETPDTTTLVVEATNGALPAFSAGQYVNVFVQVQGVRTSRPMSISAPPRADGAMELTIKRKEGGLVSGHLLETLKVGDELQISGPEGELHFNPVRDGRDLVFIAAGSGVTPFMGMIEEVLGRSSDVRVALLQGSRTADAIIFRDRLQALARGGRLRLCSTLSRSGPGWEGERGRIDAAMIGRFLEGEALAGKTFFVCGPLDLERDATRALVELGVSPSRIRVEPSGAIEDVTRRPDWPPAVRADQRFEIRVEGHAEAISARAGESLLSSFERAGVALPVLCRSGHCGSCRTRLFDGDVLRAAGPGQRHAESAAGFIHACVSHPLSDLRVAVLPDPRAHVEGDGPVKGAPEAPGVEQSPGSDSEGGATAARPRRGPRRRPLESRSERPHD
jgi:glycine betaine catabolism B